MLDPLQRRLPSGISTFVDAPAEGGAPPPPPPPPGPRTTPAHDAFYANLRAGAAEATSSATTARDERVGQKLDALRAAYAGPYQVEGQSVTAPAMFRMNGGYSDANAKLHEKEVTAIAARVGVSAYGALHGTASPRDLVKITQALIDAGKLPPGPGDLAARIKTMQWTYGIGVDCACYTRHALGATTGRSERLGLAPLGTEGFRHLDKNPSFAKTSPATVRPGDVMTLDDPGGATGHNVIVRGRTTLDAGAARELVATWGRRAEAFLTGPGPFHRIEVDSSWGAGATGETAGGVRRDTWIYDESSKTWGSIDQHANPPRFVIGAGPAGETLHGAYRAKES